MYFLWLDLFVEHSKTTKESALQKHHALEKFAGKAKTAQRTPVLFTSSHAWTGTQSTRRVFIIFDILRQMNNAAA